MRSSRTATPACPWAQASSWPPSAWSAARSGSSASGGRRPSPPELPETAAHQTPGRTADKGDTMQAAPGWYPDPGNAHVTRYWDGSRYTHERHWNGTAWVEPP